MGSGNTWMIRAGRNAAYVDDFLTEGLVALGWNQAGPLEPGVPKAKVLERMRSALPGHSPQRLASAAGQVYRFLSEIKPGDHVCTYDPVLRRYCLGTVQDPTGSREHPLGRFRKVVWTKHVSRDALSNATKNSLGAIMTLFCIPESAANELQLKATPIVDELSAPGHPVCTEPRSEADPMPGEGDPFGFEEIMSKSSDLIDESLIALGWEDLQDLFAGILRAMGYRTRVSGKGSDRGVDIFASPDGLGLEEPRVFVEVKHRPGSTMGAQELRAFLGGRQNGDRCLYVSTGGFTKEARYEAERSSVPVTLVDLPNLRDLLLQHYGELDASTTSIVPLQMLHWPVR